MDKILLTASGGPFRTFSQQQLQKVTPEQAIAHPNWDMGHKISVDSASLMNKGLEKVIDITRSLKALREEMSVGAGGYTGAADPKGPVAGYDPVLGKVDRRNKKQKNYPKEYVQMFRDAKKGNRLKSVLK